MNKNFLQPFRIWDEIDDPPVIDCAVTPIPANTGAFLQIVASLAAECHAVEVKDGIQTRFVGLYSGQLGSEVLQGIICGPGNTLVQVHFKTGERVSLRAMDATAITLGSLAIQFLSHN